MSEHGPVVLVGHSLGGSTVTRVANAVPELLERLVYISAFCCTQVASPLEALGLPEAQAEMPPGLATGSSVTGSGCSPTGAPPWVTRRRPVTAS